MIKSKTKRWDLLAKAMAISTATMALSPAFGARSKPIPRMSLKEVYSNNPKSMAPYSDFSSSCSSFQARWITIPECHIQIAIDRFEPLGDRTQDAIQQAFLGDDADSQINRARNNYNLAVVSIRDIKISPIAVNQFQFTVKIYLESRLGLFDKGINGTALILGQFSTTEGNQPNQYKVSNVVWLGMDESEDSETQLRQLLYQVGSPQEADEKTMDIVDMFLTPYMMNYLPTAPHFGMSVAKLNKRVSGANSPALP